MIHLIKRGLQPLNTQIYSQIKAKILSGELAESTRLQSVRYFAHEHNISRNTVEISYQQLLAEGYIESKPRSGYYVSAIDTAFSASREAMIGNEYYEDKANHNSCIDFNPANLSPDIFPLKIWRKLLADCAKENLYQLSIYNNPQGEIGLRREIQKYLARSRGVLCDLEQIVICAGTTQSLSILCQILQQSHSTIAMEEPGYYTARAVFTNHSLNILPITVKNDGIDTRQLAKSNSQLVYVTPSHQFPLGYVMSIANRFKLLQWAEEKNGIIIEDDYDSELCYNGQPIPSLQGLNPKGRIVYLGTFSKSLSPALRISYMVMPWNLLQQYKNMFKNYQSLVPLLDQNTLERFINQGYWDKHLRKIRVTYKRKHDILVNAIEKHFGSKATIISKGAGLHISIKILSTIIDTELADCANKSGICVYPISSCSIGEPSYMGIRLGFGSIADENIEKGVKLLHSAWFK